MTVNIEVIGIPELKRFMNKKQSAIKGAIPVGLRDAVLNMHGKIKTSIARGTNANVAVDTGRFLNSVDFEVGKDFAVVFSRITYAKHIEFGTSRMRARPHFRNTQFRERDKTKRLIEAEIARNL